MALLIMILRRMYKNKWLELSLLGGLTISVALIAAIPIYTNAVMTRMLVKDLEQQQLQSGTYPLTVYAKSYLGRTSFWNAGDYAPEARPRVIADVTGFMRDTAATGFGLPVEHLVQEMQTDLYNWIPRDPTRVDPGTNRRIRLAAMSELYDHIRLIDGRLPSGDPVDGVYEVLVVEKSLSDYNMVLGNEFVLQDGGPPDIAIKPVGVIDKSDHADPYWYRLLHEYDNTFFVDDELFQRDFASGTALPVNNISTYLVLDYTAIDLDTVQRFLQANRDLNEYLRQRFSTLTIEAPAVATIGAYFEREKALWNVVWSLNIPVLMMLAFYLYMIANLITERQKAEIAVLRSRGAGTWQIMAGYLAEWTLLGAAAFMLGPPIGMQLTKMLGASNGFLEFVGRSALSVNLTPDAYRYALFAVLGAVVMTLLPVFLATKSSIVSHSRQSARLGRTSVWHRWFLDLAFVGVSVYSLFAFRQQRDGLLRLGAEAEEFAIDPLLFFIPALFVLGAGLLVLRLYPLLVRLIYWAGRKLWPPVMYASLLQVGRSHTQYQYVMIFLIMTVAAGLFSASAAHTLNKNMDDMILYRNGADLVLQQYWPQVSTVVGRNPSNPGASGGSQRFEYREPPFVFGELPGVERATKVFVKDGAFFTAGQSRGTVRLMGIHTSQFGKIAWLRDGLLGRHWYEYLNLIALEPRAVLISRSIADQHGLEPGDRISVGWNGVDSKPFIVFGVVDYWPSFHPNRGFGDEEAPMLVVGHLDYIQAALAVEPYQVWIKLADNAERQRFYDALPEYGIGLVSLKDSIQERIDSRNDPFTLAINGFMTLGFLISVAVSFFGFLLFWVLSLARRMLQYGIFRAMGLTFLQLVGILTAEQLLVSAAAVAIGGGIGSLASLLFVDLFQLAFDPSQQVLPFEIRFASEDALKLLLIVLLMIGFGLGILGWRLSRMKIYQAVKLGED